MVDMTFAARLQQLIAVRGLSYRALAAQTYYSKSFLHDLARGRKQPNLDTATRIDDALQAGGTLVALVTSASEDETAAAELARRVNASDVSDETMSQLEAAFDDLAVRYPNTAPGLLIGPTRMHLDHVGQLLDARMTLVHHRRLLVVGGWLSLLAATLHIDMRQPDAARGRLAVATDLARHGEHDELRAWCLETRAWELLVNGEYMGAASLSRQAQALAPRGTSALIQATAQEGRAWARMHDIAATRRSLDAVDRLVSSLAQPDRPEHHYRYDPDKALSYTATTLAWAGDPAAEPYTRAVIAQLESSHGVPRPRRAALARLDLGLALVARDEIDEAAAVGVQAITSGLLVKSTWWRATEILAAVEESGLAEAADLREAYETYRP
ncbi:helix-turn-helix domain-containing protein [Rhizocola hellebori]